MRTAVYLVKKVDLKRRGYFFRQIDGQRLLLLNFLDFICILNGYECALAKFFMIKVIKVNERGPKKKYYALDSNLVLESRAAFLKLTTFLSNDIRAQLSLKMNPLFSYGDVVFDAAVP